MTRWAALCVLTLGAAAHLRPTIVVAAVALGVYAVGGRRVAIAVLVVGVGLAFAGVRIDALPAAGR